MTFEHFAINISNPHKFVEWYVTNCNLKIIKSLDNPPYTHFLADSAGKSFIEIYSNPTAKIPDYSSLHPLEFHFAFAVEDVNSSKDKLIAAGAKLIEDVILDDGSHLLMFRDPFGIALQIVKRAVPLN